MSLQNELENGEFLIFEDGGCHMVGQAQKSVQYTPSTLSLTNLHIKLNPKYDLEIPRKIALRDITKFQEKVVEDAPVLEILSDDVSQTILLFIPEEPHRIAFVKLFQKLCAANNLGQDKCNECALRYRLQMKASKDLNQFYSNINSGNENESPIDQILKPSDLSYYQLLSSFHVVFTVCNFISDIQDTSPMLFFAVLITFLGIMNILAYFFGFGFLFAFVPLTAIIVIAILQRIGRWKSVPLPDYTDAPGNIKNFMQKIDEFRHIVKVRFVWGEPQITLQTCEFLLVMCLVFYFLDPFIILAISLIGLSFFERWDPFKLGSLSKLLSQLILW
ncbi:hypothetical protein TVAG_118110 [Trichomonas vaginalis G3]|uniref:Uncharacterized protein n=1 Tax=Trichomonas vaginalis (strain ATCC PRA-98 / G3) TaxID=412133 RepID=A2EHZ8_TRIV3|nr:hypothetical protein TVAGG3_0230220 [Trichomonas vaginalis G3]EAY07730.1 hypothetical protein TVAG_118110 [Trichomonas vaginalis G3]KAI5552573.1 hypothetical protein TVAGG3_0230220 [Trichomonas vaginalis G3]|eukprot:XP_001319953.1 hypothetical protein [Trichomonas vaginalis G3]